LHGGSQTCDSRTDNDDIGRAHLKDTITLSHVTPAIIACRARPTRTRS
jgi:hypothetical protein